jgi:hypothetical protein
MISFLTEGLTFQEHVWAPDVSIVRQSLDNYFLHFKRHFLDDSLSNHYNPASSVYHIRQPQSCIVHSRGLNCQSTPLPPVSRGTSWVGSVCGGFTTASAPRISCGSLPLLRESINLVRAPAALTFERNNKPIGPAPKAFNLAGFWSDTIDDKIFLGQVTSSGILNEFCPERI